MQMALVPALQATKGFAAAIVGETLARSRALAEKVDRTDCLVPLLQDQWLYHLTRSEHRLALSIAEEIEKRGEMGGDMGAQMIGHLAHGYTSFALGQFV